MYNFAVMVISKLKQYAAKIKESHVESDGFLTKTGAVWNYKEIHSYGLGLIDGFMHPTGDHAERLEQWRGLHEDVDSQPHYFVKGWFIGHKLYFVTGILFVVSLILLISWLL